MSPIVWRGLALLIIAASWGCAAAQPTAPRSTLKPFESEEALVAHLKKIAADVQRRREEEAQARRGRPQAGRRNRAGARGEGTAAAH